MKYPRNAGVYVLELKGGYVYVGKSSNIEKRLRQHMAGTYKSMCAAFTRIHKPTGKFLKRLGDLHGHQKGDGPERDETLRLMHKIGPQKVRGWKFVRSGPLIPRELEEINDNLKELFDLCRKCGKKGHFASRCSKLS
jgi:hypothetical protein